MTKKISLSAALDQATAHHPPTEPPSRSSAPAGDDEGLGKPRQTSRIGKKNIAAYLPEDFDRSLLLVQAKAVPRKGRDQLIAEALNDLFAKYNVPQVRMWNARP